MTMPMRRTPGMKMTCSGPGSSIESGLRLLGGRRDLGFFGLLARARRLVEDPFEIVETGVEGSLLPPEKPDPAHEEQPQDDVRLDHQGRTELVDLHDLALRSLPHLVEGAALVGGEV